MSISHAQPLLLLFVSFFLLPVALGTAVEFDSCPIDHSYKGVVNVTKVEIIPYPIQFHDNPIFKISAVTSQYITGEGLDLYFYIGGNNNIVGSNQIQGSNDGLLSLYYKFCDVTKCPIEPGPFVLTFANIYDVQRSDQVLGISKVSVEVVYRKFAWIKMCTTFKFHANALVRFTNMPIPTGVSVSRVEIYPFNATVKDNPVFKITANTPKNIASSSTVSARMVFVGSSELFPKNSRVGYKLCDCTYHCPVVPGTFVLTFPHPYWRYNITAGEYRVEVQIVNQKFPFQVSMSLIFRFSIREA